MFVSFRNKRLENIKRLKQMKDLSLKLRIINLARKKKNRRILNNIRDSESVFDENSSVFDDMSSVNTDFSYLNDDIHAPDQLDTIKEEDNNQLDTIKEEDSKEDDHNQLDTIKEDKTIKEENPKMSGFKEYLNRLYNRKLREQSLKEAEKKEVEII